MKAGAVKVYGFESKFQEKALNCFNFKKVDFGNWKLTNNDPVR